MLTTPPPYKHTHYPSHTSPHPQLRYLSDGLDRSIWIELDSCSVTVNCNRHPGILVDQEDEYMESQPYEATSTELVKFEEIKRQMTIL